MFVSTNVLIFDIIYFSPSTTNFFNDFIGI